MVTLLRKFFVPLVCLALLAGGATLAIASKGGKTDGANAAVTEYAGGTGCSHGYWKKHTASWVPTGYKMTDNFDTVFGVTHYGTLTLGQALNEGGGDYNALGREAVAALLNSKTSSINYGISSAQVIKLVQEAIANEDPEPTKDALEGRNTSGCKLS